MARITLGPEDASPLLSSMENVMGRWHDLFVVLEDMDLRLRRVETLAKRAVGMELTEARREKAMASSVEELKQAAQANQDATASAIALIEGIATQLQEASGDEAEVSRIAGDLRTQARALGEAVTANTPFTPSGQS